MPSGSRLLPVVCALLLSAVSVGTQDAPLTIIRADPSGDLTTVDDADQIRVVFSEPMVAVGTVPDGRAPAWLHMTPACPGAFYWAGTRTLVFSPDASKPLSYSTKFTVRIDAAATSIAGRRLAAPYEISFTTPTLRLMNVYVRRKSDRFDSPVVIYLNFNQPVRIEDVLAHTRVSLEPHKWRKPVLLPIERAYWQAEDPEGLARFDTKVADVTRVASASDTVNVRAAELQSQVESYDDGPATAILETVGVPPPEAWLRIAINEGMPAAEGHEPHPPQSKTVNLEPALFLQHCTDCSDNRPHRISDVGFTRPVSVSVTADALSVTDITRPGESREISREAPGEVAQYAYRPLALLGFGAQPPMSRWRVGLKDLQALDGQVLGYSWAGLSEAGHYSADYAFGGSVFEARSGSRLPFIARNIASIRKWLLPVSPSSVVPSLQNINEVAFGADLYVNAPRIRPPGIGEETVLTLTPDVVERHRLDVTGLLTSGTGLVWATALEPQPIAGSGLSTFSDSYSAVLQVTNLGVTVKHGPLSTLVFVTSLDMGLPVGDATVTILDMQNVARWTGRTTRDGIASAPALDLPRDHPSSLRFVVTAEKNGDVAFVASTWNREGQTGAQNLRYGSWYRTDRLLRGSLFTDRGAYRQGDRVHVKAVLREDTPQGMKLLTPGTRLDLVLTDPRSEDSIRSAVTVNEWSSIEWTWNVPSDAALGTYDLEVSRETGEDEVVNSVRGSFLVAAYRTPEFRVEATLSNTGGTLGSPIQGRIEARYLFGSPVGARPVNWTMRRAYTSVAPATVRAAYPLEKYAIGYVPADQTRTDGAGDFPAESRSLDADGRIGFTVPTPAGQDAAYQYNVDANVAAASGQNIAARGSLIVYPASLFVAVTRPTSFATTRDGANVAVATVGADGRAVSGVRVELTLLRTEWTYGTTWTRTETPSGSWSVTTTSTEVPVRLEIPRTGAYTLRAIARDSAGRPTRTDTSFYGVGPDRPSWRSEGNRIELVSERPAWKPGETARILVQSPWERATALLTVEREGIRRHQTFTITSMQDTIDVPLSEADVPNVFVSVVLVKGRTAEARSADGTDPGRPAYRIGHLELKVDSARKRLRVDVAADRQEYRPGRAASLGVTVTDADGRPSESEVTFWAVDEGVLSLTGYSLPDFVAAIYQPKPLEVMTSDNRERLLMALDDDEDAAPSRFPLVPRGGRMPLDTSNARQMQAFKWLPGFDRDGTRKDLRPLVFWLGSMTTGRDGRGRETVRLPDSLTAYRIMAVAGDRASRFGAGELEIRSAKTLTLLPALPRFLSPGDRATFGATVTYAGASGAEAVVTIESDEPAVVRLGMPARQLIRLEPGKPQLVTFDAVAGTTGATRVRMSVRAGEETDAFELRLPVTATLKPQITAAYGVVTDGAVKEGLVVPPGAGANRGALTVELASTALVGLGESARYVTDYSHNGAEQRASRALVYLLSSKLDGAFRLSTVGPDEYRTAAKTELTALVLHQCGGDFALFPGQCERISPYLSAYVMHVLQVARSMGVDVDDGALLRRSLAYWREAIRQAPEPPGSPYVRASEKAYIVKVLAEAGEDVDVDKVPGLASIENLPIFAVSFLADALHAQGDHGPTYQDLIRRITNALRVTADRLHVEERDEAALSWMFLTDVGSTAIVLEGLSRRGDAPELGVPLVRWLMGSRHQGHWGQTHSNARALEALVAYYTAHESETPRMTATAAIGQTRIASIAFKERSTSGRQIVVPMRELLEHVAAGVAPPLIISRQGPGTVHYTARLQTFAPDDAAAFDQGFQVERSYELFTPNGKGTVATTFAAGDIVRVRLRLALGGEGQYLALTDPLPAGFEAIDEHFETSERVRAPDYSRRWWAFGSFDHVEKHDDRVLAYATRMGSGTHELTYLVRAMTTGTFSAAGATLEAMYTPEWTGRSAAATVRVR